MKGKRPGIVEYVPWFILSAIGIYARHAPRFMRYWGYGSLTTLAYFLWRSRLKMALEHIRLAFPNEPEPKLLKIARGSYANISRLATEFFHMRYITKENMGQYVTFTGFENFERAFDRGNGVVLVWAHFDNFEMVHYALAVLGYPVHTLIRKVDNQLLDEKTDKMREESGQKIIKREGAAGEMIRRLREGGVVAIAADQNALFNSVFVKFFGKWASTIKSPAVMHLRTGAPIIPYYSVNEKDGRHTAVFLPEIKTEPTGDVKADVARITQKIADVQADFIATRPDLWLWIHRRWKIQPNEKELAELGGPT
ncbi:MAG: lysophospholipid acyltransferase family protein [Nitrospinae bacterium]|nr:lysophospholipid acyltransferase family protein [Nitrospinota bacterium]